MLLRDTSFVVVDVETTGLSAANHRITELAMVRVESGTITETFQSLLNPEQYISPFITRHTGITNAMVYGKPKFGELIPEIRKFLEFDMPHPPNPLLPAGRRGSKPLSQQGEGLGVRIDPVLVGHNVKFDHGFLIESFARAGSDFQVNQSILCTCRLARRLLPNLRSKSLSSVQAYFGIKNPHQHRALADAEATAKILSHFIEMASQLEIETLEEFHRLQFAKPKYPRQKTKRELSLREKVRFFPERPGVYTMLHGNGTALYVGKAKNLRERVSTYFAHSHTDGTKLTQLMRVARDITYEETGSELSRAALRKQKNKRAESPFQFNGAPLQAAKFYPARRSKRFPGTLFHSRTGPRWRGLFRPVQIPRCRRRRSWKF